MIYRWRVGWGPFGTVSLKLLRHHRWWFATKVDSCLFFPVDMSLSEAKRVLLSREKSRRQNYREQSRILK